MDYQLFLKKESRSYTKEDLIELEQIEKCIQFSSFTSEDALKLGTLIVESCYKYEEEAAIQILRLKDEAILFQYIGNSAKNRNIGFVQGKMNTVKETGHSSIWPLLKYFAGEEIEINESCIPVSGAFPIFVNGKLTHIVGISGLHHGNDMRALLDAFCLFLDIELPLFTNEYI